MIIGVLGYWEEDHRSVILITLHHGHVYSKLNLSSYSCLQLHLVNMAHSTGTSLIASDQPSIPPERNLAPTIYRLFYSFVQSRCVYTLLRELLPCIPWGNNFTNPSACILFLLSLTLQFHFFPKLLR